MTQKSLPIVPLREPNLVVFPGGVCEIDVGRVCSVNAVKLAQEKYENQVIVAIQNDQTIETPAAKNFYSICSTAEIKKVIPLDGDGTKLKIIVMGIERAQLKTVGRSEGDNWALCGYYEPFTEKYDFEISGAIIETITRIKEIIVSFLPSVVLEEKPDPQNPEEVSMLVDNIVGQLPITGKEKLRFLRTKDPRNRLEDLYVLLTQLAQKPEGFQQNAGGREADVEADELKKLKKMIDEAGMPEETAKIVKQEFRRLSMMPPNGAEWQVAFNYVETLAKLPWSKSTEDVIDVDLAQKVLDEDHYGLEKVKERILEFLAVRKLAPDRKGSIICLYGPPGTGKTSIGKSIARAMGRKFIRTSLGGVNDEAEIRGHRRTYVGALPGRIIQKIKEVGVNNPVFMLDEVDKLYQNIKGDPAAALLEALDPEQNNAFTDNYLSVPFDLSKVLFIATVNEVSTIMPALRDRLEIIELPGYSTFDKVNIARNHLIPKQKKENGLVEHNIALTDEAVQHIIDEYTSEAGVRTLERSCGTVFRKLAVKVAGNKEIPAIVEMSQIPELLGPPRMFVEKKLEGGPEVGLSTGLAWSRNGGSLLFVEATFIPGKGDIKLTGNLGEVLKESATTAYAWIKSHYEVLGIDFEKFSKNDVHLHFPAGAIPKDGPSAGIAITMAMLSLFTGKPVRNDVAMTGEITLKGRVLPVGGVREKVLAAHRAGITTIVYPHQNHYDIDELPADVKKDITFIEAKSLIDMADIILVKGVNGELGEMATGNKKNLINVQPC